MNRTRRRKLTPLGREIAFKDGRLAYVDMTPLQKRITYLDSIRPLPPTRFVPLPASARRVYLPASRPSRPTLPSAPSDWRLGPVDYLRIDTSPAHVDVSGGVFSFRAADPIRSVSDGDGPVVIEGRMVPYNQWTEIRSKAEGHFLERFAPGALAKTIKDRASTVRALFEHGFDSTLGRQVIATVDGMWEQADGAYFRATLLDGVPPLLVEGVRKGLYGSSVRFQPETSDRDDRPGRSTHNPKGIPEVTVRAAHLREFSVTPFPAYPGATATARS